MKHFATPYLGTTSGRRAFPFSRVTPRAAPLIEVLIPLFDGEPALARTLASVSAQDWPGWALRVRDDGSRDGGPALVRAFAGTIPERQVCLTGGGHRGLARGAMTLLAEADARAAIAVLADSGAELPPDALGRVARDLQAAGDVPALSLALPGRRDGRVVEIEFRHALLGRLPRPALLAVNRAALDLLRIASAWRGPVPCHVAWACRLVAGAGGRVTAQRRGCTVAGSRPPRGAAGSRADDLAALRAAGPLLSGGARRLIEAIADDRQTSAGGARGLLRGRLRPRGDRVCRPS